MRLNRKAIAAATLSLAIVPVSMTFAASSGRQIGK